MSELVDRLRAAIQAVIDAESYADEGWHLAQFVVVMGLERMETDGSVESSSWYWTPPGQADWMTIGLLESGMDMHTAAEVDGD